MTAPPAQRSMRVHAWADGAGAVTPNTFFANSGYTSANIGATTLRISRKLSVLGAGVNGTCAGRSKAKPVCSTTSSTLWPG